MNTEQLRTFLTLAETGNFSLSAKSLIVAQSTISKRIFELESEVGKPLFERGRTGATLTQAGKAFLEYAERILHMEEKAIEQIHQDSRYAGSLTLGTAYAYYDTYLQKQISYFIKMHPEISVRIEFGHSGRIITELKKSRIDIGYSHHPYTNPEFFCQKVHEDDVVLVTNAANRVYCRGISFREIRNLPLLFSNFLYTPTFSWLFPKRQQFQLEVEIASAAIPFLKDSHWYTMLARKQVEKELAEGSMIEIPILDGLIPPVEYYMLLRKGDSHPYALKTWMEFVRSACTPEG